MNCPIVHDVPRPRMRSEHVAHAEPTPAQTPPADHRPSDQPQDAVPSEEEQTRRHAENQLRQVSAEQLRAMQRRSRQDPQETRRDMMLAEG